MSVTDISKLVNTSHPALPQIYAYTTPEIARHNGWTKIGYTEQNVDTRLKQQMHTADVEYKLEWHGNATYEDTGETFHDTDFHGYLRRLDIVSKPGTEWFEIEPSPAHQRFYEFRENHGIVGDALAPVEYRLRDEQERASEKTVDYAHLHERGEFLWNAKPRFGKTLTSYDFCKRIGAQKILIVTNRPAIANSWYDDYVKFVGFESGLAFISSISTLQGKPYCLSREQYRKGFNNGVPKGFIEFVSLQDLKGAIDFGGKYDKLAHVAELEWDVLIIDEAHEGVDTFKTDVAFDHIKRKFTLHLSGTPFKAIANEKFPEDAIFNWTYADEQKAKKDWDNPELPNPYAELPRLNMFTYQMSDIVAGEIKRGIDIDGENVEYTFDLNEFFATNENGYFLHNDDVNRFLDALTTQKKFPFSTSELRDELRHTLWMLNRVDSAKALAKKLKQHPVFRDYEIVLAAGDGKLDDDEVSAQAFDKVCKAIAEHDYTITLSVGQLTTGVTIPEWTAVLMLSNMKSPALYMQAAFRAQNPCLFNRNGKFLRKENAYVFDFDPARTLTIFEEFANDLYTDTASGGGTADDRKQRVRTLLNFFPVIGEDENGEMVELDAERVLSIPRKIRSREVVRRGFMSDFLFQNISNIFRAPAEVLNVLQKLEPYKAPNKELGVREDTADELNLNENGEVEIPQEQVIGLANGIFGEKVYSSIADELDDVIDTIIVDEDGDSDDVFLDNLQSIFSDSIAKPLVEAANEKYGDEFRSSQQKKVERRIKADVDIRLHREVGNFTIERNRIEKERASQLDLAQTQEEADEINRAHDKRIENARQSLVENLKDSCDELVKSAGETVVREVETAKRENKKQTIEGSIRDHLRGFSRTIPSFLMAYGDEDTTLAHFDQIIPEDVFFEVTSVTVEQFCLLRDGGDVTDPESGETVHFEGQLFDPVVFDDSVHEFISLRGKLANYFDDSQDEDIFDYVPPQKTNQIFTPRAVVVKMVDLFEQENPGCFDDPDHTFADLYMKSGLYITEVIKRLFNSEKMCDLFPNDRTRLNHILEEQVFGIAPTEIIYKIATNYILGANGEVGGGCDTNFVKADSAELAKEGKLAEFVEQAFGGKL
ncbi:type III restriction enzyme, res subunit [Atopobium sp. ICM42b]|uniref:DEAD/DEAH box helicase family protein n=1 Tax=Atopobium sp. ICM42b TaxID=1190620 RepID=UPI00044F35F1|nr:DEAD/DEAH box helicase family protein [Atopobium sp. ICM42b]EWC94476.1 type III restriction enzyme, res subunit [Atopobium sp. ICM42b]